MSLKISSVAVLLAGPAGAWVAAQEPIPLGEEFQVNSYTTDDQAGAAVAADSDGNFVVVWESLGSYGPDLDRSIQGQIYTAGGNPLGLQFEVNAYTTSGQRRPSVAVQPNGDFVVVWEGDGYGTDTDGPSIQARRFDALGVPIGAQFQVNTYTTNWQTRSAIAAGPSGDFVVVWSSFEDSVIGFEDIKAQRFAADGTPLGGEFLANTFTPGRNLFPRVAVGLSGDFLIVWMGYGPPDPDVGIHARLFAADGTPQSDQFQINTFAAGSQDFPEVAASSTGGFLVTWASAGSDGTDTDGDSVQAQRLDAEGAPVGGEFQVNAYTTNAQRHPSVAFGPGGFLIAWDSVGSDGTDTNLSSTHGQVYDSDGSPLGGQFQVNSYTSSYQGSPAVAANAQGNFVVVWNSDGSYGTDNDSWSIQGQRYSTAIFADGFESGDTSAWTSTVQ